MERHPNQTAALARILAAQFLRECRAGFTRAELRVIRQLNASPPYSETRSCATHDLCDANELMADAMKTLGLAAPFDAGGADGTDEAALEASCDLWNQAWELASPALRGVTPVDCYSVRPVHHPRQTVWEVVWYDADGNPDAIDFGDCTEDGPEPYPEFPTAAAAWAAIPAEADDMDSDPDSIINQMTPEERAGWAEVGAALDARDAREAGQ